MVLIKNNLQKFANYKDVVQGCSAKTVTEYLFDLRTFSRFLVASRNGLDTDGEEFENIDIRSLGTDFFESVTTSEIYDFLSFVKNGRGNEERARDTLDKERGEQQCGKSLIIQIKK